MLAQQGLCIDSAVRQSDRATVSGKRTFLCRHCRYAAARLNHRGGRDHALHFMACEVRIAWASLAKISLARLDCWAEALWLMDIPAATEECKADGASRAIEWCSLNCAADLRENSTSIRAN